MQSIRSWVEEGQEDGRQEGALMILLRQLSCQVGHIELQLLAQLYELSLEQLEDLGEALLGFSSSMDLAVWLKCQREPSFQNSETTLANTLSHGRDG